jgi:capsular exopolysaccharide synthesis family protein
VLAILLPSIFLILKLFFNDQIHGKEQLFKLTNVPLLGVIGHNNNKSGFPLLEYPKSSISESFRSLRINLQYLNSGSKAQVIGVTSSISGEGKTFCSLNLATAISLSGAKTILIGGDLRKPKLNKELNMSLDIGLSSYLIGKSNIQDIIKPSGIENLDVVMSGPIPPNPIELLGSKKTAEFFEYLKSNYDYIMIDSPPIGLVSDYFVLKNFIDAHIYIVRNNYTKIKAIEGVNELYSKKEMKNLFLVLNDIKPEGLGRYGYYYQYGYGYGYYEESERKPWLLKKFDELFKRKKA